MTSGVDGFIERNFSLAMCYAANGLTARLADAEQARPDGLTESDQTILGEEVHHALAAFFNQGALVSPDISHVDVFRGALERAVRAAFIRM